MKNKVLLVDDSITIHRVIDLSIDTDKYETIKVFTEEAATQKLKETSFEFVLLDYKLENANIPAYIATIKNIQPSAKVILLIGAFDKFAPENLISTGAEDYLVKPFDSQSLNTKLTVIPGRAKHSEDTDTSSSQAEPKETDGSLMERPLNDNFIKNMAQADLERENTVTKPLAPKPVNTDSLFHDPSINPSKTVIKGNQISLERNSPFDEDQAPEQKEESFDPLTQFEDLKLVAENNDNFGISPFDNMQKEPDNDNTIDKGFAQEKTFEYEDSPAMTLPEAEFGAGSVSNENDTFQENNDTVPYTENIPSDENATTSHSEDQNSQISDAENYTPQSFDEDNQETQTSYHEINSDSENILNQSTEMPENAYPKEAMPEAAKSDTITEREVNMDKTDGTEFYRLDDDEIFNNKPVAQIFEEEILSLNSPEKENGTGKPLSQKFEEEILSVEEPREMQLQSASSSNTDSAETEFYNPANIETITEDSERTKNISQKFEEEILSIDSPGENNQQANQDYTDKKNIIETFDDEILSLGAPDVTDQQEKPTSPTDSFINDDFITKEFADIGFLKEDIINIEKIESGVANKNDDLILQPLEVADEKIDDDLFEAEIKSIAESSEDIFTAEAKQSGEPIDDIFNNHTKTPENTPSIMDETLDLDKLLEMDMSELSTTPSVNLTTPAEHQDFLTEETETAIDKIDDDPLFSESAEQDFAIKPEDDIFAFGATEMVKKEKLTEKIDDADFDLVQMDAPSPASKEHDNSILSGITVTISKEEIMKMLGNALDKQFLEQAVQEVLAQNMREIVRAVVPAIAEKFIKEEIEKLKDN